MRAIPWVEIMAKNVSKTINPLHFEDFEAHRFEDLIRQLAHGFRPWRNLEATGLLGNDDGVDIRGIEVVPALAEPAEELSDDQTAEFNAGPMLEERVWRFQCKRYQTIGPTLMRKIVNETVPDSSSAPYGLIVAAACNVSDKTIAAFHEERIELGVSEGHLWTKAHLEDMLFRPEHDHLLFAYFGISLVTKRRSQVRDIQANLTVKRKVMRALEIQHVNARPSKEILIRSVDDVHYPHEEFIKEFDEINFSPWHTAMCEHLHVKGLLVSVFDFQGWYQPDGSWDITRKLRSRCGRSIDNRYRASWTEDDRAKDRKKRETEAELYGHVPEAERASITAYILLPYSAIVEIDPWGDPLFAGPHVFCQFKDFEWGPYEEYYGLSVRQKQRVQDLDETQRKPLFEPLLKSLSEKKS
jgi:hypothetical protein